MEQRTTQFIQLFNQLEHHLKGFLNIEGFMPFSKMLYEVGKKDQFVKNNLEVLESISNLRNVLIHEEGSIIMAVPSEESIGILEKIVTRLNQPILLLDLFSSQVVTLEENSPISDALALMNNKGITHIPVYSNGTYKAVLTGSVIARWLGSVSQGNQRIAFDSQFVKIQHLLKHHETTDQATLLPRNMTVDQFINQYGSKASNTTTFLITQNGKINEKPLAIITTSDYPRIWGAFEG